LQRPQRRGFTPPLPEQEVVEPRVLALLLEVVEGAAAGFEWYSVACIDAALEVAAPGTLFAQSAPPPRRTVSCLLGWVGGQAASSREEAYTLYTRDHAVHRARAVDVSDMLDRVVYWGRICAFEIR
jgi:hypothetical protein